MLDDIDAKEEEDEAREQEKVEKNLQKLSLDEKVKVILSYKFYA